MRPHRPSVNSSVNSSPFIRSSYVELENEESLTTMQPSAGSVQHQPLLTGNDSKIDDDIQIGLLY